jgi:hypothetical protein
MKRENKEITNRTRKFSELAERAREIKYREKYMNVKEKKERATRSSPPLV